MSGKVLEKSVDEKCFEEWIVVKRELHEAGNMPNIREGDVYWCGFGENVGVEINGKNEMFSRPVLVLKKLSRLGFLGVPLTSKLHEGSWYVTFEFNKRKEVAVLAQVRVFSVSRLYSRMGQIDETDFARVKEGFHKLFCG